MSGLTFRQRLTLQWTLAFGVLLALVASTIYVGARLYLYADLDAQLRTLAATEVGSSTDGPDGAIHLHEFPLVPSDPQQYVDKVVQIVSEDGRVLLQTSNLDRRDPLLDAVALREARSSELAALSTSIGGRPARVTALPAPLADEIYIVTVGVFTERLAATLSRLAGLLLAVWFGGLALTSVLGFTLASRALLPVGHITRQAAAIARGHFDTRLDEAPFDDEIGRMSRLLNEMLDRLRAAIDANQQFAADASHELRGPLTAIRGEVDVALRRPRSADEYRETLEAVGRQAHELTALTEDLTILVRAREGQGSTPSEMVPLLPLIQASAGRLAGLAGEHDVTMRVEAFPELQALGNPALLAHVFGNLLENAVRYNRQGGRVTVTGAVEPASGADALGSVVVRIADTGIGITQPDRTRVFERFYRVDSSRSRRTGGTGLGLAICREVLDLFGGSITVADSSNDGTIMEVRLPGRGTSGAVTSSHLTPEPARAGSAS